MANVRIYILSVISVAIIVAVLLRLTNKKKTVYRLIQMMGSLLIAFTILSPLVRFRIDDLLREFDTIKADSSIIINDAKTEAIDNKATIISNSIQSYISDKAALYGADITVSVDYTNECSIIPDMVEIEGQISPHTKKILKNIIAKDLGIQEDKQIWK